MVMRWSVVIVVVLAALISFMWFRTMSNAGEFTTLVPRFDGDCAPLPGYVGAEDLALDPETRVLYAATTDRRALWREGQETRGAIWAIPFDAPETARHVDLTGGEPEVFHAHGIDLHIDDAGVRRIFAVNHVADEDHIEIFRLEPDGRLRLERTVADPLIRNVNDVAATGPDSFYFTIDQEAETGSFAELIEGILQRRTGKVAHYDGASARVLATGLQYANGLAVSHDGRTLYVAETVGRGLAIFDRDPATNDLEQREKAYLGTGVDNITLDEAGRLFIGAHPKLLTFALGHAKDPSKDAPSQVIVIDPDNVDGFGKGADQVFLSLGEDISGSAVGVVDVDARRMFIGSVYEDHLLVCTLPEVWRHSQAHPASRPVNRGDS